MSSHPALFSPITLGALELPTRIVMAPMTRNRAGSDGTATPLMATYYAQRATAGLIVAEMTWVAAHGRSYLQTPGLATPEHVATWRRVTDAVHAAGGRIVVQLAHGGRASHPSILDGVVPVAPSAIAPAGSTHTADGPQPHVTPRALETHEIAGLVDDFAQAVRRAREAGFDGVELHAANGYLLDQFLRDGTNRRTDAYGGSVKQRTRFLLEVVEAASAAWLPERVGVRLSPFNDFNSMHDSDPAQTFTWVAAALRPFALAYLHLVEPIGSAPSALTPRLRAAFGGRVIANGNYSATEAGAAIAARQVDAVSFGAAFLANPDLPARFALGAPLNAPDPSTFYTGGARGYVDYLPLLEAA